MILQPKSGEMPVLEDADPTDAGPRLSLRASLASIAALSLTLWLSIGLLASLFGLI